MLGAAAGRELAGAFAADDDRRGAPPPPPPPPKPAAGRAPAARIRRPTRAIHAA